MSQPLAERLRPKSLSDYIGQPHLIGEKGILNNQLKQGIIPSLILWGPPGTGKTSLAELIAKETNRPFYKLSAINSGVKDIREVVAKVKTNNNLFSTKNPILFIDEIHRFSKSQQDSLLEIVEKGIVTLIGATTENPSFEVIKALLSRCQVYTLNNFSKEDLELLINKAILKDDVLKTKEITVVETKLLIKYSGGDGRKLLNLLEILVNSFDKKSSIIITDKLVSEKLTESLAKYDKDGEQHYDIASALIKSIRGSDPNAAVYYLARMLEGGEDISFIARRLIISASEDIGLANPTALVMANNTYQTVNIIGMPEARIILSQCVIYLATSPKSNSCYASINEALALVRETGDLSVPLNLRNAPTKLMKELGYGDNYKYSHNYNNNFVSQELLPSEIKNTSLYRAGNNSKENSIKNHLENLWGNKYRF